MASSNASGDTPALVQKKKKAGVSDIKTLRLTVWKLDNSFQ